MNSGPDSPISADLASFIESALPSVWALEVLLLLRRDADRAWGVAPLVAELRASHQLVADCLAGLERAGLVARREALVQYAPASPGLAALCEALEAAYRERPVAVVKTIAARRPDPLKGFADSFRFRGWTT